jgi:hypothetical protein
LSESATTPKAEHVKFVGFDGIAQVPADQAAHFYDWLEHMILTRCGDDGVVALATTVVDTVETAYDWLSHQDDSDAALNAATLYTRDGTPVPPLEGDTNG